jgi:hypothetical protein
VDLEIQTTPPEFTEILRDLGFVIQKRESHISAMKKNSGGRMHAAFIQTAESVYCDLHYDYRVHFLLFGVDYKEKPRRYFEESMMETLQQKGIAFELRTVNWFTRKNKAVFRGFRL